MRTLVLLCLLSCQVTRSTALLPAQDILSGQSRIRKAHAIAAGAANDLGMADETRFHAAATACDGLGDVGMTTLGVEILQRSEHVSDHPHDDQHLSSVRAPFGNWTATQHDQLLHTREVEISRAFAEATLRLQEQDRAFAAERKQLQSRQQELDRKAKRFRTLAVMVGLILCVGLVFVLLVGHFQLRRVKRRLQDEIAESNRNRQVLASLENRVQNTRHLESLGVLAGGIAHDFNNLLVAIQCNAELLDMRSMTSGNRSEYVVGILESAESASRLSAQILDYSRQRKFERKRCELRDIAENMRPLLLCGSDGHFQISIIADINETVHVDIDVGQFEQILLNLVSNAKQAMPEGGLIELHVGRERIGPRAIDDPHMFGVQTRFGEFGFVEVVDHGCGIAADNVRRIFEPFYSSTPGSQGLGLAVVFGNVKRHDGLIRCFSRVGGGTRVRVLVPSNTSPLNDAVEQDGRDQSETLSYRPTDELLDRLVVIIDDEPMVIATTERILKAHGWRTKSFLSGYDGLRFVLANVDQISCIALDVMLPDLNGLDFLRELDEKQLEVPVVVMSGVRNLDHQTIESFPNVSDLLDKPFSVNRFAHAIHQASCRATGRPSNVFQTCAIRPIGGDG